MGFYNPATFILAGSDALQKQLNEYLETHAVANNAGKVVFANPFVAFNGTSEGSKAEKKIPNTKKKKKKKKKKRKKIPSAPKGF